MNYSHYIISDSSFLHCLAHHVSWCDTGSTRSSTFLSLSAHRMTPNPDMHRGLHLNSVYHHFGSATRYYLQETGKVELNDDKFQLNQTYRWNIFWFLSHLICVNQEWRSSGVALLRSYRCWEAWGVSRGWGWRRFGWYCTIGRCCCCLSLLPPWCHPPSPSAN